MTKYRSVFAGKTWWIYYALRRCLEEKRPVLWYRSKEYYLFSDSGFEVVDLKSISYPEPTWCFVDSKSADSLFDEICDPDNGLFPIYVTSPKQRRWDKLHQQDRYPNVVVMNPWTRAELEKA